MHTYACLCLLLSFECNQGKISFYGQINKRTPVQASQRLNKKGRGTFNVELFIWTEGAKK